jgi:hypothetical protein
MDEVSWFSFLSLPAHATSVSKFGQREGRVPLALAGAQDERAEHGPSLLKARVDLPAVGYTNGARRAGTSGRFCRGGGDRARAVR